MLQKFEHLDFAERAVTLLRSKINRSYQSYRR